MTEKPKYERAGRIIWASPDGKAVTIHNKIPRMDGRKIVKRNGERLAALAWSEGMGGWVLVDLRDGDSSGPYHATIAAAGAWLTAPAVTPRTAESGGAA